MVVSRALIASALVWASACTADELPAGGETGETGEGGESETGPPIFDPPDAECGNGYIEEGEQCDDANEDDDDGCDRECQVPCGMLWEATIPSPAEDLSPYAIDLAVGPSGEIVVAGLTNAQTSELDNDIWLGAWSSAGEPLWSGVYDLVTDLDDAPAAVIVGPGGAVYLSATIQAADGTDIWVGRFDETGTEIWSAVFDSPIVGSPDAASGIAITPTGNPVVAGHMRVGEGDSDLWIAELSPTDGAELWSTTWSGEFADNGYSFDKGGPLAIGSDGTIWATAIEYVNYETFDAHVLSFDPTGTLLGDWAPQADLATAHDHDPVTIAVQADGSVYFSITRLGPGTTFWIHRLDPSDGGATGEISWVREMPSFVDVGEDWINFGLAAAPDGNVFAGGFLYREDSEDAWYEGWMHRLDAGGEPLCATRHAGTGTSILRPNLFVTAIGANASGELVAAGRLVDVESQSFWVGSFRGP